MKKCIIILVLSLIFPIVLFGCGKNDNDKYFETDESIMIPRLISTEKDSPFETIAKNISPAIVAIASVTNAGTSIGSGVCVYSGGYILTNEHVVSGATSIKLYLFNGDTANAISLWSDKNMDIAILKSDIALPYLPLNEDNYSIGEDVMAVGTPLDLIFTHTFTKGIISAVDRTLELESVNGISYMQNLIQHDASINPGNSGGPLINSTGEIVGINTLKVTSGEGLGFAIPTKSFRNVITQVVNNREYQTPYFGILGFDASIAMYYGSNFDTNGVYITSVDINSPAYISGLREGDIIIKFKNKDISNMLDLKSELFSCSTNDTVSLEYIRDNTVFSTSVTLSNKK